MSNNYLLHLENVHKRYPRRDQDKRSQDLSTGAVTAERTILHDINLRVRPGEFISVIGPSGCGKSTLLRLLLGSEHPSEGRVLVGGKPVKGPDRDRGIVFQKYSLFPHLTVAENIAFGLDLEEFTMLSRYSRFFHYRRRKRQYREQAQSFLERMQLADAGEKYPHELSGGMRQRVAIAQAAIMEPDVLLMDEPFGALDDTTRQEMQMFLLELWERTRMTVLFITHDLEEAIFLGTRVLVLSQYFSSDEPIEGAKIVADKEVPGEHPKPSDFKYSPEFSQLLSQIRSEGLDPKVRQHVSEFDLSHRDASHRDAWKAEA
jgi:NitT/TauT family transport system ATP-binding protein